MIADFATAVACRFPNSASFWFLRKATGTQITGAQLSAISQEVRGRNDCRLLVFGLGYDSIYWHRLNHRGRTLFLEDNDEWIASIKGEHPELAVEPVSYWTRQRDWRKAPKAGNRLSLVLPKSVNDQRWDVILVDAPAGWHEDAPGRSQSIYTAAELCDPEGSVFVHDCEREAEAFWCDCIFSPARLVRQVEGTRKQGWLRQYRAVAPDPVLIEEPAKSS